MSDDAINALIARLSNLQARVALPRDRTVVRQMVMADSLHMLSAVPPSARNVMASIQVEGRMHALQCGHPGAAVLILGTQAQMIGMMTLDPSNGDAIALLDMMILPGQRGQGHGAEALAALCAIADDQGRPVHARLFYDSPAKRLLERAGFAVTDETGTEISMIRAAA
jgi:GNAT superfamily N-acetyltransferase